MNPEVEIPSVMPPVHRKVLLTYCLITLLLLTDIWLILYQKMSFAGYWSDRILFWLWTAGSIVVLCLFWKKIWTKIYLGVLITSTAFLVLSGTFILMVITGAGKTDDLSVKNNRYRVQLVNSMVTRPFLQIIKNKGLLEEVIINDNADLIRNPNLKIGYETIKEVRIIKETPDSLILKFTTPWRDVVKSYPLNPDRESIRRKP
ncbi:hypothetical protein [Pedobacter caeni]|uniref:Uncharacterized protein n=1 Tax=Pedobacter caeni TaxID=288992 RepID=A0A1M5M8M9_9SPHI|nr:hypothetical protein [Pedobacter caeni]SHG73637.1 hypothetical protein SAMN04488522_107104 [Pedobacter caeni]